MAAAAALSFSGALPTASAAYDTVWSTLMPVGAALLLLGSPTDASAARAVPHALQAFAVAAAGTVVGTTAAWAAFGHLLGPSGGAVAAALCATYIGGSLNFAAVIQVHARHACMCHPYTTLPYAETRNLLQLCNSPLLPPVSHPVYSMRAA